MMPMSKVDTEYLKHFWPMRHYLVTCGSGEPANIITVSFCMPVSREPPMVACAIGRKMYSSEIIHETGEFIVNVPPEDLECQVYFCGFHSGRDVDKFKETGLTPLPARHVDTPIIAECIAHMECRVVRSVRTGDKNLFIATVLDAYADEDIEQGRRTVRYGAGDFPKKVYGGRLDGARDEAAPPRKPNGGGATHR
jgi:flavin reductase (DIM6/NTAB) family NADH-FMN oxidoreductase RutF